MTLRCRQTPRRVARVGVLAMVLLAFTLLAAGCRHTPAEQQVRQAIEAGATAARNGDTAGVLKVVADDFTGNAGDFDRRSLRQFLAWRALRQDRTGVLVGPITFARQGDRITATFNLVLTGGKPGDLLPDQSAIYAMTTAWRREHGEWVCYNATWRQRG